MAYWGKIIESSEEEEVDEEDEGEDDEEDDDNEEEDDNLGWIAREWIDYIKEYNRPLYLELTHNGTLEQAAREKQVKYFRKLDQLQASSNYTEEAAEELTRKYLYPNKKQ